MIDEQKVLLRIKGISAVQLRVWVAQEWVKPAQSESAAAFNDADLARIQLLHLLDNQLDVGREAIPIILSLIDQVHGVCEKMQVISDAIDAQPDDIRTEILERVRRNT